MQMSLIIQNKSPEQIKLYIIIFSLILITGIILFFLKSSFRIALKNYVKNHKFLIITLFSFYALYIVSRLFFTNSLFKTLFDEDGVFEYLTSLFYILSFVLFLFSVSKFNTLYINTYIIILALACFFVGMEEISWGQRIFNIETPESYKQLNYQEEFNVHNLISPEYHPKIFLIFAILCLVFFAFSSNKKYDALFWVHRDYLPSKKFLVIALLLPFISWYNMEHFEVILSFMFCIYSFQLFLKKKNMYYEYKNNTQTD